MRFVPIGLLAAVFVAGVAPAASGATFTATIKGTVHTGTDFEGVFGLGSDLSGLPFQAVYTINDRAPGAIIVDALGSSSISGVGSVSSVLSINGSAPMVFGASAGSAEASNLPDRYHLMTQSRSTIGLDGPGTLFTVARTQDLSFFFGSLFSDFTDGNFRTPFAFTPAFDSSGTGLLEISEQANLGGDPPVQGIAYAALDVSSFRLAARPSPSVGAGVPEPATWAMLILGFGAVGARLRARRESLASQVSGSTLAGWRAGSEILRPASEPHRLRFRR